MRKIVALALVAVFTLGAFSSAQASEPVSVVIVASDPRDYTAALQTLARWDDAVALAISTAASCDSITGAIIVCFDAELGGVFEQFDSGGVAYVNPTSEYDAKRRYFRKECRDTNRPRRCLRRAVALFISQPVQRVLCHEIGHGLGLGHNDRATSCMGAGWMPDAIDLSDVSH